MTTITSLATRNRGAEPLDEQLNVLEVTNFDEPVCHEFTMYQLVYGDRVICDTIDSNQARRLLGSLKTQTLSDELFSSYPQIDSSKNSARIKRVDLKKLKA